MFRNYSNRFYFSALILLLTGKVAPFHLKNEKSNNRIIDFEDIVAESGLSLKKHEVLTEDEYFLTLYQIKIPDGVKQIDDPPVILAHGLFCDATTWIINGEDQSLGLLLPKLGYDVWFANFRGTKSSWKHKRLKQTDSAYWRFSFHELGIYDVPAIIDYVTLYTGNREVYYIGFSQGATELYVTLSRKPEYNKYIKLGVALSPIAYFGHMISPLFKAICPFWAHISEGKLFVDINNALIKRLLKVCLIEQKISQPALCSLTLFTLGGFDRTLIDFYNVPKYTSYAPTGSSNRMLSHYCQLYYSNEFEEYNEQFTFDNVKGASLGRYNLSAVTAPMALIWGKNDFLTRQKDLKRLKKELPNVVLDMRVDYDLFSHSDFIFARNVTELVYKPFLTFMQTNKRV